MGVHAWRSHRVIERCQALARLSEEPIRTTRTFLSPPMHEVHRVLRGWMEHLGMQVRVDAVGNLRGFYPGRDQSAPRLLIGSHVDTVPGGGAFDGVLGVVLGIVLLEALGHCWPSFSIEVVAFSEEEGVRFGIPFLGSRALIGTLAATLLERKDERGLTVAQAIRDFGLDPSRVGEAVLEGEVLGYLEFHIEQGPVLDSLQLPLGVVEAIAGQSRLEVIFRGEANHAGTTPMHLRRDALAAAAEWITLVEREACATPGLVTTVGSIEVRPNAGNVIPGEVRASLDVRHPLDDTRVRSAGRIIHNAQQVASSRNLTLEWETRLDQPAVACNDDLVTALEQAVQAAGYPVHRMVSGAGHDAMVLAKKVPAAMLFLRSPGGISHHPDETVRPEDVEAALQVGLQFLDELQRHCS